MLSGPKPTSAAPFSRIVRVFRRRLRGVPVLEIYAALALLFLFLPVLMLVILFLQRRPSGLFAVKGRHADA